MAVVHRRCRSHRAQGIVLMELRDAEDRHDGVADVLLDGAAVGSMAAAQRVEVAGHAPGAGLRGRAAPRCGSNRPCRRRRCDDLADLARRLGDFRKGGSAGLAEPGSLGVRLGAVGADPHRCIVVRDDDPAETARAPEHDWSQPAATSEPERPGVARAVARASRTWAARPSSVEPQHAPQVRHGSVVDEPLAGDADDPDCDVAVCRIGQSGLLDELEDSAPEPADDDALLEGHEHPLPASLVEDQLPVEWPREPGVDDADRPALGRQHVGRRHRPRDDRPEPDEQQVVPSRRTSPWPIGSTDGVDRLEPETRVTRVVQRERVVLRQRGPQAAIAAPARPWATR